MCPILAGIFPLLACNGGDDNQTLSPVALAMTTQVAPSYDDGETQIYQVQIPVSLPVRDPTGAERDALRGDVQPYGRSPYLLAADERVEIRYVLTNLDDQPRTVELLIDPWNEFVRYRPGVQADGEEALPNFSGWQDHVVLPPKGRKIGVITADDTLELAIDLATAQNIIENPPADPNANVAGLVNRAFNRQNRSSLPDALVGPYIPQVIAGIVGFDLGLRSNAPANVAVEIVVDVKDLHGERMIPLARYNEFMGPPGNVLSPPGAR
jgi:hypothetical protein